VLLSSHPTLRGTGLSDGGRSRSYCMTIEMANHVASINVDPVIDNESLIRECDNARVHDIG
jgi:hypothetical protein